MAIPPPPPPPAPPGASRSMEPAPQAKPEPVSHCRHGAPDGAPLQCTRCRAIRCANCCERRKVRLELAWLCPCGGFCVERPKRETRTSDGPFEDLVLSITDVAAPGTRSRLVMAALLLGAASILSILGPLGAIGVGLAAIGRLYVVVWLLRVVRLTPLSPERATDWPDLVDPLDDLVWPFFRALAAGAVAFAPAIACAVVLDPGSITFAISLVFGLAVFPPVMAALAVRESLAALWPPLVARLLRSAPTRFAIASSWLALSVGISLADDFLLDRVPFAGNLLDAAVALVLAFVFARFLGRLVGSLTAE